LHACCQGDFLVSVPIYRGRRLISSGVTRGALKESMITACAWQSRFSIHHGNMVAQKNASVRLAIAQ
jgi:hypothetical protein